MNEAAIPTWRCHKIVSADRVVSVSSEAFDAMHPLGPQSVHTWHLAGGASIVAGGSLRHRVPAGRNYDPIGGYYVRYEDGYESWSPAEAFESGYTRLP